MGPAAHVHGSWPSESPSRGKGEKGERPVQGWGRVIDSFARCSSTVGQSGRIGRGASPDGDTAPSLGCHPFEEGWRPASPRQLGRGRQSLMPASRLAEGLLVIWSCGRGPSFGVWLVVMLLAGDRQPSSPLCPSPPSLSAALMLVFGTFLVRPMLTLEEKVREARGGVDD